MIPIAVGLVAACGLWRTLPSGVITLNDDFGYYRSVLETAARGRPWTDDWLEPWAASLSVLSAVIFKLTGSFQLATQGLQAAGYGVAAFVTAGLLRRRGQSAWAAGGLALLIFTCPTLLWKGLEFTALAVYVPCLLLALGAAERERWGWFAAWTVIALASRQSAAAWLALPAIGCLQGWMARSRTGPGRWVGPVLAGAAVLAAYALCQIGMNSTHAQRLMGSHMWASLRVANFTQTLPFAAALTLTCIGAANALSWLGAGAPSAWRSARSFALCALLPAAALLLLFSLRSRFEVQFEHGLYHGPAGQFYLCAVLALAVFGWLIAPVRCDIRLLGAALAAFGVSSLRGATWDYYWIDLAAFAFFAVQPVAPPTKPATRWLLPCVFACMWALLLWPAWYFVTRSKQTLDEFRANEVVLEKALRQGEILPSDLSIAPFGLAGWHLYPYFIRTDEGAHAYIAEFQRYLAKDSLRWETRGADNPNPIAQPETVVRYEAFRLGWHRGRHQFILRRQSPATAAELPINPVLYRSEPFPLSDEEWRAWRPAYSSPAR